MDRIYTKGHTDTVTGRSMREIQIYTIFILYVRLKHSHEPFL